MIRKFYEADCMGNSSSPKFGGAEMLESKSTQSTQEGETVEEVLQKYVAGNMNFGVRKLVFKAMTEYASIVSATDKARIAELEKENETAKQLLITALQNHTTLIQELNQKVERLRGLFPNTWNTSL